MNDAAIFAIGSALFIMLSWATMSFLLLQFSALYRNEQVDDAAANAPQPEAG
ncbi:MAG: hypothetical protein KJO36_05725 [Acidimicrobiia bacterium]|nr:hypothetical protein [Acidimicrobiia bacterium]MBT8249200.1 hypothetical protein [Acidimicrobiia bacterium]NNC42195.1 hypothetical protein [Acidimicrobiia bacterium]NNL27371.1 hypothetical protein [Acidimicrobiia bacterium]NNL47481.1 hypothetical protein [Acidimicrobiia bacterium]